MNLNRNYLIFPAIIVIIMSVLSGFTNQSNEVNVENLVTNRAHIMQRAFYNQISLQEAETQLAEIEVSPILTEDITNLRNWENQDLDVVKKINFISIEQKKNFMGYLTYNASISWDMCGLSEDYTMIGDYYIVLKLIDDKYLLSKFEPY